MDLKDFNKSLTDLVEQRENDVKNNWSFVTQKNEEVNIPCTFMAVEEHGRPFVSAMAINEHGRPFDRNRNLMKMAILEHGRPFNRNKSNNRNNNFVTLMGVDEHGKPYNFVCNSDDEN
jgi:hypothetical protein